MRVIGITGKARAGKDTTAEYLYAEHEANFETVYKDALASSLKNACEAIFSLTYDELYGPDKEKYNSHWQVTPRYLLQYFGTEVMREHFGPSIWIDSLNVKLEVIKDHYHTAIITDVRFDNEAEWIKSLPGGCVIEVVRPVRPDIAESAKEHPSEAGVDPELIDHTIINNGSLAELERLVHATYTAIRST